MARILIIEDDPLILNLYAKVLRKNGHDISLAVDGAVGIDYLKQGQYDLVITDIVMPEKDGIEVIISLSELAHRPAIIAISGGSSRLVADDLLHIARVMKVDLVMQKPIEVLQLSDAVESVLRNRTP